MSDAQLGAATLQALAAFGLLCARLLPLAVLGPWAALRRIPLALGLALTVLLALCLWPAVRVPVLPASPAAFFALAAREAAIGLVYGLAFALPVSAFEWAGALMGRFAGAGGAEVVYARLQLWLAAAAFFALGGHRIALTALADSFAVQPLGVIARAPDLSGLALGSARLVADAYGFALLLALPVGAAVALAELVLALAARSAFAPALALAAAPARAGIALLVVWMGLFVALSALPAEIARGLRAAARLLQDL